MIAVGFPADALGFSPPSLFGSPVGNRIDLVADETMPSGHVLWLRADLALVDPRMLLQLRIELHPGLTYRQRTTMHERMRYDERRRRAKGTPKPTFDGLLAFVGGAP